MSKGGGGAYIVFPTFDAEFNSAKIQNSLCAMRVRGGGHKIRPAQPTLPHRTGSGQTCAWKGSAQDIPYSSETGPG